MKWKELERLAINSGWRLLRHGKKHDIYIKGIDSEPLLIERHWSQEVRPGLLMKIFRQIEGKYEN
ncbi:MAG: type II toxin-antitoxin system HicA family toxin [Bacteroidales bacterium]|nr:type II toxin-antitoxin system HicA family toxin [Bacteroidales bacterium]